MNIVNGKTTDIINLSYDRDETGHGCPAPGDFGLAAHEPLSSHDGVAA